jgi:hypothetical protein
MVAGLPSGLKTYSVFGINLITGFPFSTRLTPGIGPPDVYFACIEKPACDFDRGKISPDYVSPIRMPDNKHSLLSLYRLKECDVLCYTGKIYYYLYSDRILCYAFDSEPSYLVEHGLLSLALAVWLELRGLIVLHASAVVVEGMGIAFLASSGTGKSTLAATMLSVPNSALLTDDFLPVEQVNQSILLRSAYPEITLDPYPASRIFGNNINIMTTRPGSAKVPVYIGRGQLDKFYERSYPLNSLYVPERLAAIDLCNGMEIHDLTPREAVIELIRYSIAPNVLNVMGLASWRLNFFAQLVRRVPVRRMIFPDGLEYLPKVRDAILQDLEHRLI